MKLKNISAVLLPMVAAFFCIGMSGCCSDDKCKVKNVIMLIGDGMGTTHISALMLEENYAPINMERAQSAALIKTYSANNRVTDSAAAGTALACGKKTDNKMLGLTSSGDTLISNIAIANSLGMQTAIVASSDITHATPAAFYAHVPHRDNREDIAMWLTKADINVIFGGGITAFNNRSDSINLLDNFKERGYFVASETSQIDSITNGNVIGLFADSHLNSVINNRGELLPDAAKKALEIVTNNCNKEGCGFFMMIEGSQIDFESHSNNSKGIYAEMKDFDKVIGLAFDYADLHPGTLVVVCADHETGGVSIPSCNTDFTSSESGVEYKFGSTGHTATMTSALFYGTCADEFGAIMDNTELAKKIRSLISGKE